jgi:hypothetical protein
MPPGAHKALPTEYCCWSPASSKNIPSAAILFRLCCSWRATYPTCKCMWANLPNLLPRYRVRLSITKSTPLRATTPAPNISATGCLKPCRATSLPFLPTGKNVNPTCLHSLAQAALQAQNKMKAIKKENLPAKICITCQRPFSWRKKWEKVWPEVKYCSDRCRMNKPKTAPAP